MKTVLRLDACAKINWALAVTGVREDGYHTLDMLMQRVSLCDMLYAAPAGELSLRVIGPPVPGAQEKNLVFRAAMVLRRFAPSAGARLTLVKRIPQGAGLGGGSSDAAAALRLLCRLWQLKLTSEQLCDIALTLGADVPFFIKGAPARVRGIGEELTAVALPARLPLVLLKLSEGLSTALVYRRSDGSPRPDVRIDQALPLLAEGRLSAAAPFLGNALYPAALSLQPVLEDAKRALRRSGASFVQMTGSGSAVFGVFETDAAACRAAQVLRQQYPEAFVTEAKTVS